MMIRPTRCLAALAAALALGACGKDAPPPAPPKPVAQPGAPVKPAAAPAKPVAAVPAAAPKPAPAPVPALSPDQQLRANVRAALEASKDVPGQQIDVTVKDGVVTLWGTVADAKEQAAAAATARALPGVKSVENKLSIVRGS